MESIDVIISIIGIRISSKPPDETHPFGHSRFEPLVAFLIGVALPIVAYEIGRDAVFRILHRSTIGVNSILSILSKEAMARYSIYVGKKLNS
ncbi:cation transporter [Thermococcus sp.]